MMKAADLVNREEYSLPHDLMRLRELVCEAMPGEGMRRLSENVWVSRSSTGAAPVFAVYDPVLCVVAQGSKEIRLGDDRYVYDSSRCLLNTVALPVSSQLIEASRDRPFLAVSVILDPALVRSVIVEAGLRAPETRRPLRAMEASPIDSSLLNAVLRLARLARSQDVDNYLAPLAMREIVYRLLAGEKGARLYQSAFPAGQADSVIGAIEWLRKNFDKPLRIETLARECGMSSSGLHHHFKTVTAMSPLRFQKQLRLQEARRLMVAEGLDAAGAGFKVGYEDASYFNRDYKRFFGAPPHRDAAGLRD